MINALVSKRDGSAERVALEFPAALIEKCLAAAGDENSLLELYCDRPKGWAATLSQDSLSKLLPLTLEAQTRWHGLYERFLLKRMDTANKALQRMIGET